MPGRATGRAIEKLSALAGSTHFGDNSPELLQEILFWTGGQPFLTQFLGDLAVNRVKIPNGVSVKEWVAELIKAEILENWQRQERLVSHFQRIENGFARGDPSSLSALNLYLQVLQHPEGSNVAIAIGSLWTC